MARAHQSLITQLIRVIRKPAFWLILGLFVLITVSHYSEAFGYTELFAYIIPGIGLTRHALERVLYLVPLIWSGFLFGFRGTIITSLAALACMLPRAISISPSPTDAIAETGAVFVTGSAISSLLAFSMNLLHREREHTNQLRMAQQELRTSEERYRELFESANDAIWLHDLQDNIITANKSLSRLTGYTLEELSNIKSHQLFTEGCIDDVKEGECLPLETEAIGYLSEVTLVRKDGSKACVQLSTNPLFSNGQVVRFQHIARDITQEKQMQKNLRFYLQQATRAQEEERKRISRELHDETIQALVVLSRQLEALASSSQGLPEESRLRLEQLWQQTNNIMQGVRRLSQDLRPAALDRLGLVAVLERLAAEVAKYSAITPKVNVLGNEHRLGEEVEVVLFRIVQEALRNAVRHSQATSVEITVEFDQNKTRITVSDNGNGFSLPQTIGDLAKDGKLGLAGMHERAQLIGATLTIESQPGKGCTITAELPA